MQLDRKYFLPKFQKAEADEGENNNLKIQLNWLKISVLNDFQNLFNYNISIV